MFKVFLKIYFLTYIIFKIIFENRFNFYLHIFSSKYQIFLKKLSGFCLINDNNQIKLRDNIWSI